MSTTSLFVEILIIGLEALVWLGILLSTIWDPAACLDMLKAYGNYSALFTTLLLALAYVLGIIIDRLADSFYRMFRYASKVPLPAPVGEMRLRIMHDSEGMAKFLDYQRSRLRIARATVFNLVVTVIMIVIWLIRLDIADALVLASVIGAGTLAIALSLTATRRIDKAQIERLVQAYGIISEYGEKNNTSRRLVAAVCYRRRNSEIEFLLVRTKGGKYWTFPKGHVKGYPAEPPWYAAGREAGEEAGVGGLVEREPFTHYAYYKGGDAQDEKVAAFLMRVDLQRKPDEPDRDPTWFTSQEAMKKLAEGRRETRFALEHKRVVEEAVVRLKKEPSTGNE
jgi:predicted NUDIX family NTP pyrophosphohydrolase